MTPTFTPTPTFTSTPTATLPPVCVTLAPNGPGDFAPQADGYGCTQNWQCTQTSDGDATYVSSPPTLATGPEIDVYAIEDMAPHTEAVASVNVRIVSRSVSGSRSSSATPQLKLAIGSTLYGGSPLYTTTAYTEATTIYPTNPATGVAWTWDEVNSLQAGVRHQVAAGDQVRTTRVTVDVCWIPSTSLPATPTPAGFGVGGFIYYAGSNLPVSGATVQLASTSGLVAGIDALQSQTNPAGEFSFNSLGTGNWQVAPQKQGDKGDAISALDAVYVLQASLALRALSPEQQLACDVSGNGALSALDAALILQYKIGLLSAFPAAQLCGSDWAFIPQPGPASNQEVVQPRLSPGACQAGMIAFRPLMAPAENQNFAAVVFGDCTGNWQPTGAGGGAAGGAAALSVRTRNRPEVRLGRLAHKRSQLRIPIVVDNAGSFHGLDVRIYYDPAQLPAPTVRPLCDARQALLAVNDSVPGTLVVSLANSEPLAGGPVLMLRFVTRDRTIGPDAVRIMHASVQH